MKRLFPQSFYNVVTFAGAALSAVSFLLILFLMGIEALSAHPKPYIGIIAFVILPAFFLLGIAIATFGVLREHRRLQSGTASEMRLPVINLNEPVHQRTAVLISIGLAVLLLFTAFGSFKAYEYTDSDEFCGQVCHKVMEPEYTAYKHSPHAKVGCVQCHIGPGADWFVRSKISGAYQLYSVAFDKYSRPIETPIRDLRPAQETCEGCHWPRHFFSEKLRVHTYFSTEKGNRRSTIHLLMKIGGGSEESGLTSGIHWHMNVANEVTYAETDPKRLTIPWVQVKSRNGNVRIYRSRESTLSDEDIRKALKRRMDCIDCHNRPTHIFQAPDRSVNHLMALGWIDPALPSIKKIAVDALDAPYSSKQVGLESIKFFVEDYYRKNHPDVAAAKAEQIERAIKELQRLFSRYYFPSMKASWKSFPNHIGHMHSPGCFRCHDDKHVSDDGRVLNRNCSICHSILSQEIGDGKGTVSLSGIEYVHPVDIGESWKVLNCHDCHWKK